MKKDLMGLEVPVFYKGDLVAPAFDRVSGWRRSSPAEREAWYNRLGEDCRAEFDVPYDSGGESKLAPCDTWFDIPRGTVLTVTRGRVRAAQGWGTSKDCCEVFNPANGETLFVRRVLLTNKW